MVLLVLAAVEPRARSVLMSAALRSGAVVLDLLSLAVATLLWSPADFKCDMFVNVS